MYDYQTVHCIPQNFYLSIPSAHNSKDIKHLSIPPSSNYPNTTEFLPPESLFPLRIFLPLPPPKSLPRLFLSKCLPHTTSRSLLHSSHWPQFNHPHIPKARPLLLQSHQSRAQLPRVSSQLITLLPAPPPNILHDAIVAQALLAASDSSSLGQFTGVELPERMISL